MSTPTTSHVVPNFTRVSIAPGLACPSCGAAFSPHAMSVDLVTVTLRCEHCHTDALVCRPCITLVDIEEDDE
jgi:hypothetical protein